MTGKIIFYTSITGIVFSIVFAIGLVVAEPIRFAVEGLGRQKATVWLEYAEISTTTNAVVLQNVDNETYVFVTSGPEESEILARHFASQNLFEFEFVERRSGFGEYDMPPWQIYRGVLAFAP